MVNILVDQIQAIPTLLINQEFQDIESLSSIFGWDLDWRQIEPGALVFRVTAFGHVDISVMRVEFNRSFHQIGSPPPGSLTLGLPDVESGKLKCSGADIKPGTLINFSYGNKLDTVNPGMFGGYVISFSETALSTAFADMGLDQKSIEEIRQFRFWDSSAGEHEQLRRMLHALTEIVRTEGSDGLKRWGLIFNQDLPSITARILSSESHHPEVSTPKFQARALERALHILSEYDQMPKNISALSILAGASWSTLERAFQNVFGIAPKAYIKVRRLAAVQAELVKLGPEATISEVASQWGFRHMSDFAADYRKQFGELPSQTLERISRTD